MRLLITMCTLNHSVQLPLPSAVTDHPVQSSCATTIHRSCAVTNLHVRPPFIDHVQSLIVMCDHHSSIMFSHRSSCVTTIHHVQLPICLVTECMMLLLPSVVSRGDHDSGVTHSATSVLYTGSSEVTHGDHLPHRITSDRIT